MPLLVSLTFLLTAHKIKFSIKTFFPKCDHFPADLVTFTEEILNEKLHFLGSECCQLSYLT